MWPHPQGGTGRVRATGEAAYVRRTRVWRALRAAATRVQAVICDWYTATSGHRR